MNDYELKLKEYKDKVLKDDKELFDNTTLTGLELKLSISNIVMHYDEQIEKSLGRISYARESKKSHIEIDLLLNEWVELKLIRDFWKSKLIS